MSDGAMERSVLRNSCQIPCLFLVAFVSNITVVNSFYHERNPLLVRAVLRVVGFDGHGEQ
jgi:hypothetical protein